MEGCFHYVALCQEISVYGYPMAVSCRSELSNDRIGCIAKISGLAENTEQAGLYTVVTVHTGLYVCLGMVLHA